jgi:hypothetical protein
MRTSSTCFEWVLPDFLLFVIPDIGDFVIPALSRDPERTADLCKGQRCTVDPGVFARGDKVCHSRLIRDLWSD